MAHGVAGANPGVVRHLGDSEEWHRMGSFMRGVSPDGTLGTGAGRHGDDLHDLHDVHDLHDLHDLDDRAPERRLRVLHLITHLGFGGAQDNTLVTVERLDRERYEVHLACGLDHTDWLERGRRAADALVTIPSLTRAPSVGSDARALRDVTGLLRRGRYDIVHTHSSMAGAIGRIAARRAGVPVVVHTYHAFAWKASPEAHEGRGHAVRVAGRRSLYLGVERWTASMTDALITVSELNRREAIALHLAPPEKLVTIFSGIDFARFVASAPVPVLRRRLGLDPDRPVVGFVGRLDVQKAPLDFVAAAQRVLARRPDAQIAIVGDGHLRDVVAAATAQEPRIALLGYRDDVPDVLAALDVFAQSSLWEGMGRSATEAMFMRRPVAATAVDGVPELVEHGLTGLLSPPGDPAALAEHVGWLLDHPEEADRMGDRGHDRVVPAFSADGMVDAIDALYRRLVEGPRRATTPGAAFRRRAAGRTPVSG